MIHLEKKTKKKLQIMWKKTAVHCTLIFEEYIYIRLKNKIKIKIEACMFV